MTALPLAPVIPSSGPSAARQRPRSTAGRPLPLACPDPLPPAPGDVVYGIGRIDASGRIADRAVISALGWRGGDRLTLTADADVVTARRAPGGLVTLPARAYVAVPAALRRRCGLKPGDRVLLWPRSPATTCSLPTRPLWCTRPSVPTARSRTGIAPAQWPTSAVVSRGGRNAADIFVPHTDIRTAGEGGDHGSDRVVGLRPACRLP
jgi:hypothetical protein